MPHKDDQFTKLFKYLERRFGALEAQLADKADKADMACIYEALDTILTQQKIEEHERLAMRRQLERHERRITAFKTSAAKKL